MKKKLIINFFYQAAYQLLLVILPVITIPIVSNALGPTGIGKYNYVNSIVAYFVLVAGLGMTNYGIREISMVRDNKYKMSKKFWELEGFNLIFSVITLLLYLTICFFLSDILFFLISSFSVLSCLFDITWFFSGIEDFKVITIRNFLIKMSSFIMIILFINGPEDLYLYFLINSLSILISQASLWLSIKKHVYWVNIHIKDCLAHFKPALEFFIAKIAITLYQNTTKTILGIMTSMTVVGYYSNAYALVMISGNVVNAMNTIMIPRMSNMYGNKDESGMIRILQKIIHIQLFFTIAIMFGIMLINNKMIGWFFGSSFSRIEDVITWLSPVVVFQSFQMAVASQYLIPRKQMREYNISIFIGALITVICTVALVPFFEIYGAVAGINLGYIVVSFLRLRVLVKETTFQLEYDKILKFIISGIGMWRITDLLTSSMSSSFITTVLQIFLGTISYFGISFILKANPIVDLFKKI